MDGGYMALEGLDQVMRALDRLFGLVQDAAMKGIRKGGMNIISDAQMNLRNNSSVVTGLLRQSGRVQDAGDLSVDVGFFDTTNRNSGYAFYVEYGRRAGKMPPPDELAQWAYKKFHMRDRKAARSMGWGMAVNIAKKGTQPHPFFMPAVRKNYQKILNAIKDAVGRKTK